MKHYVGMDLHSNNTVIAVIDEDFKRKLCIKQANNLKLILKTLEAFKNSISGIVIESTFNWYWLADGLIESGYRVHLANPCAIQQYKGIKYTDDKHDAYWLAKLLRLNILPVGYIHERSERQLRDLFRKRLLLVRQRIQHILSFKSLLKRNLCKNLPTDSVKSLKEDAIDQMISEPHLNLSAKTNIAMIKAINQQTKIIEKEILNCVKSNYPYDNLTSVPGIGKALAITILLETGNIHRFKSVGNYASYCRCVPAKRLSNSKVKGKNNKKNGNKYLAWAYVEAANFCKRFSPEAQKYYKKKAYKTNKIIAIKALAHKIARACYYIIKDNVQFDETKMFNLPSKDKGCSSEPKTGLDSEPITPIGQATTAAEQY